MTNFERIKAMNIDEMAEEFRSAAATAACAACSLAENFCSDKKCFLHTDKDVWLRWLEREVEEDEGMDND